MATFPKMCRLLAEMYALQDSENLRTSEEFVSYCEEFGFTFAIANAIFDEVVEATPRAENMIVIAFEELAELFGISADSLADYDSIRDVINK
jgi:hypothetical protein